MIQRKRNAETVEEFALGAVPVKRIIWGREPRQGTPGEQNLPAHGPVALLDITGHPQVNITDLARVYQVDVRGGEGPTAYGWDYWMQPGNFLIRLTLGYTSPVRVEFSVVFRCSDPHHWTFLRWVAENQGMVVLADEFAGPIPEVFDDSVHSMLLVETDGAEQVGEVLRHVSISEAERKKGRTLTGLELVLAALEARRYISFEDVAAQAAGVLGMEVLGRERILLKTFQDHLDVPYPGISLPFQMLLYQAARQKNVGVALLDGVPHLIRLDWARKMGQL